MQGKRRNFFGEIGFMLAVITKFPCLHIMGMKSFFKEYNNMSNRKILIVGGDIRQIYCGEKLSKSADVYFIGFEKADIQPKIPREKSCGYALLPISPPTASGELSAPFSNKKIFTADILSYLTDNAVIFTGIHPEKASVFFSDFTLISYTEQEDFALKNAISTAEGAVLTALENLNVTLSGLPVLIVGMGRISSALVSILKGFGADITVAVRNSRGRAKAAVFGVKSIFTEDISGEFPLVFNTAPNLVFDEKKLRKFAENTLFIELASKPYGFDFQAGEQFHRKIILASGLPAKKAPVTAGYDLADTISAIIGERGIAYDR